MVRLLASLRKEWLLLRRDWHAILVLFVMPSAFVLIMSLALQDNLAGHEGLYLDGTLQRDDPSHIAQLFEEELFRHPALQLQAVKPADNSEKPLRQNHSFSIHILPQFSSAYNGLDNLQVGVELRFSPDFGLRERLLAKAAVEQAFARFNTTLLAGELGFDRAYAEQEFLKQGFIAAVDADRAPLQPNSVQQNVPAWLVFAMFFIAIPISTTFIQERNQKTLVRLRSLGAPLSAIFTAKLLPYFVINCVQLMLMLAMGAWVIPWLGGQALSLDVSLPGLALISVSVSLAALGFASLVAAIARSIEQATVLSGACNILFAALGGVMVPTFIMPPVMQTLSNLSPMAWGLQGYLEILLRQGTPATVLPACAALTGFGLVTLLLSLAKLHSERTV